MTTFELEEAFFEKDSNFENIALSEEGRSLLVEYVESALMQSGLPHSDVEEWMEEKDIFEEADGLASSNTVSEIIHSVVLEYVSWLKEKVEIFNASDATLIEDALRYSNIHPIDD